MLLRSMLTAAVATLGAGPGAPAPAPVVTVVATDYHLALPATLPAGPTTFELVNHGKEPHQLYLVRLDGGKTEADLVAAFKAGGPPPSWAVDAGGPNGVDPGATSTRVTVNLRPGRYAALCVIPSSDGTAHVMKGMIGEVMVKPAAKARPVVNVKPDATVALVDYGFRSSSPLTTRTHHVVVRNTDKQSHELELVRLQPGKTVQEFLAWTEHMAGPPPGSFLGGVAPIAPGQSNELELALAPGHYALICFLPDARDGKPHFAHGMAKEITLR